MAVVAGCGGSDRAGGDAADARGSTSRVQLQKKLTTDAMMAHLTKLQEIADANKGNRALGTPGYAASADYVAKTLRDNGFDVATDEFEVKLPFADKPSVTVGGADVKTNPLGFTIGTPPEGVRGPLVPARAEDTPGCTASDYDGLPVSGAVVLVDRGAVPLRRQAGGGRRTRRDRDDRRRQRRQRRGGRHARRGHRREDPGPRRHQGRRCAAARQPGRRP